VSVEGCVKAFMQLAGTRAADRRGGHVVAQRPGPPRRGGQAGRADLAVVERRAPLPTTRGGPRACNEAAVPAQQRLRVDLEARPAGLGQCPADRGEQGAVGGLEPGTCDLAAQH
jgi:hypothetical protein